MTDGALAGLRVIDAATLAAGPLIATWMGEQGARSEERRVGKECVP